MYFVSLNFFNGKIDIHGLWQNLNSLVVNKTRLPILSILHMYDAIPISLPQLRKTYQLQSSLNMENNYVCLNQCKYLHMYL